LAIVTSACATRDAPITQPATTGSTTTTTTVAVEPLAWAACDAGLQCATLTVPLDYDRPAGEQIDLAVARRPSTDPDPVGALVVNPGGPGGSGISFLRNGGLRDLGDEFDVVSWDPRGVGASRGLACAADTSFFDLDPSPDDDTERAALEQSARAMADECTSADPALLPTLTTRSSARDLEQLRKAMGDEPLNYVGFSYGTHIGLDYAASFPQHVRAMVLDGVVDPGESLTEFLTGQAVAVEAALVGVQDAYRELASRLEVAPIPADDGQMVGPGLLGVAAVEAIYRPNDVARLQRALDDGLAGDGTALAALAAGYIGEASFAGYLGVLCADSPHPAAGDAWWGAIATMEGAAPDFGAGVGNELLPCAYWSVRTDQPPGPTTWPDSLPPLLLVAATGDAATPIDDAERVHDRVPRSALLVRDGDGHTSYGVSECVRRAVRGYLVDGVVPDEGRRCPS
jgi:pimeloyl-ACP methyl ester carboxylesterase